MRSGAGRRRQGSGIGRGRLETVRARLGSEVSVILAAVSGSEPFYERVGMGRIAGALRVELTS